MSAVKFTSIEEFLADLKADSQKINCVRICIETHAVNDGKDNVFVRAGFIVKDDNQERELRELEFYCGDDSSHSLEGTYNAQEVVDGLNKHLVKLGIEFGGGAYV